EGQVYQFIKLSKRGAYDFASDGFVSDTLTKINTGNKDAVNILNSHLINEKWILDTTIKRINIISMNGKVVAATDFLSVGKDVSEEDFFKRGITGVNIIESYRLEDRLSEIAVTSIIRDRITHTPIGLLVNFVSLSALNDVLTGELNREYGALTSNMDRYRTLKLYLVNKENYVLTGPGLLRGAVFDQQVKSYPVQECLEHGKEFSGFYKDYRGIDVAGASMCIPSMKWVLLAELDSSEGFAPLASMRRNAMTGGSVVIGLILLFAIYIFKKVVLPLRKVYAAAENIAGGNYDTVITVETGDEIGKVSHSINQMARDIKERTKLLIENEGQFRAIIDNSEAVIYLKDIEGRYILINRKYEELFHITKEEIKGKTDFDIFPENIASSFYANDLEVLKVKRPVRFEESAPHKDGIHYYLSMKVPVFDSYGIPFATCGISTDITERKQMEDENNILKNISMSIARSVDFDSALREVLARVCEFTNWIFAEAWFPGSGGTVLEYGSVCYSRDEKGKRLCDLSKDYTFPLGVGLPGRVWQTQRPEWLKDITYSSASFFRSEIAAEAGIKAGLGVPIIAGNSVLAVLTFFMSDVREEDERVINIVCAVAAQLGPIFQHRHAEYLRYEIQQRYEALVNSLNVGIFRGIPDGRILEVNQAVVNIYEAVSIQELLGYKSGDLFNDRKRYDELISEILESGFIKDAVVECRTLKGKGSGHLFPQ
ncbi:MAG: PAS domain-containing protein, partial [Nitrospira sp.]|nr:PAS domain-containing protein [Nitrospira sp.]